MSIILSLTLKSTNDERCVKYRDVDDADLAKELWPVTGPFSRHSALAGSP